MAKVDKVVKRDLKNLIFIIESLDSYRVGKVKSIKPIESAFYELSFDIPLKWKSIRRILEIILRFPLKNGRMFKWYRRLSMSKYLVYAGVPILFVSAVLVYLPGYGILPWLILLVGLVIVYTSTLMNIIGVRKIYRFYEEHIDELRSKTTKLKNAIQILINAMRKLISEYNMDPTKYALRLYNADYDGIEILAEPGRYRRKYLCLVKPLEEEIEEEV
ncbi:MAG: hypothetical protein DRO23_00855 [Thermoprotei archaeon]|nr:MAG: hypothetical protein DRO23_00855 [Thermoprotei archaeon]